MGLRRQTVKHIFGTFDALAGNTPFLTRTLEKVRIEMSLAVLAYNVTRMIQLFGIQPLLRVNGTDVFARPLSRPAVTRRIGSWSERERQL